MGQFKVVKDKIHRAYESGRASVLRVRGRIGTADESAQSPNGATTRGVRPRPAPAPGAGARATAGGGPVRTEKRSKAPEAVRSGGADSGGPPSRPTNRETGDRQVPDGLRLAAAWAWRLLLLAGAGWVALLVIAELQVVVVPIAISLLLSALLSPAVRVLVRWRVPRSLAAALVLVGGFGAVIGTLTLVVNQFIDGAPNLAEKATAGIDQIQKSLENGPLRLSPERMADINRAITGWFAGEDGSWASGVFSTASTVGHVLTGLFLVLFTTFFFLRDGRKIVQFLSGMLPRRTRGPVLSAADASWTTLVSYVRATVLVAFIDALGIGLALVILDVPFPFALAALVFLGAFVPIVGATVSGAIAVLIAFVDQGLVKALILLAAVIAVQQIEGHLLQPLIMGRAVAIHPLAVILAIAAGIVLGGIVGALVAVPIVAVLNTGIRHLAEQRRAREAGEEPLPVPPTGPPMPGAAGMSLEPYPGR